MSNFSSTEKIFRFCRSIIPSSLFKALQPSYHRTLALLGALLYRFPSKKLIVIAVTGTKGKSSTLELCNAVFEEAGHKTALTSTIRVKFGSESLPNKTKMTLPGRFYVQRFLRQAVDKGCSVAFIEMTSEGARQSRHRFIEFDSLIFTNLTPEHIESHGSFSKYREAKMSIAKALNKSSKSDRHLIINSDDEASYPYLNEFKNVSKHHYSLSDAKHLVCSKAGIKFLWDSLSITSPLEGNFNASNILAALSCAKAFKIEPSAMQSGISCLKVIPGRVEHVLGGQPFDVVVDYAHTPESLTALFDTFSNQRKICVFGGTGGGRDTWKRARMGKIADHYCNEIILTDEDPYDESPLSIIKDIKEGIVKTKTSTIIDRRKAIEHGISIAQPTDAVLITGKGTDPYIMRKNGDKEPWSDFEIAQNSLKKAGYHE